MLNTKQRAQLRALANPLAVTLIIGKEGVTEAVERELDALLESHELVKGKVLESAMLTPRTVSEALCEATGADAVQCIGSKFVVYRQSSDDFCQHTPRLRGQHFRNVRCARKNGLLRHAKRRCAAR